MHILSVKNNLEVDIVNKEQKRVGLESKKKLNLSVNLESRYTFNISSLYCDLSSKHFVLETVVFVTVIKTDNYGFSF